MIIKIVIFLMFPTAELCFGRYFCVNWCEIETLIKLLEPCYFQLLKIQTKESDLKVIGEIA